MVGSSRGLSGAGSARLLVVGHREGTSTMNTGLREGRAGRGGPSGVPDQTALQGSSLYVGSELLKFEEPVSTQEPGTFFFRTPKVRLPRRAQLLDSKEGPWGWGVHRGWPAIRVWP